MEFGIAVASTTESWRVVARAEELGFAEAWFYDTQLLNPDVFVCMALAAERTSRIRLATGVLIPSNRIAPVAANCLATLNRLAPGRIKLGVGTGFTGRRTMGLPAIKLADLREYLRVVQALLRGETVEWETEGAAPQDPLPQPRLRPHQHRRPDPARDLRVRAQGAPPDRRARRRMAQLRRRGRDRDRRARRHEGGLARRRPRVRGAARGRVHARLRARAGRGGRQPAREGAGGNAGRRHAPRPGRDPGARSAARQAAARDRTGARRLSRRSTSRTNPPTRAISRSIAAISCTCVRRKRASITGDLLRALAWVGTETELRERVAALEAAGYTQIAIQVVEGHEDAIEDWARVFGLGVAARRAAG